MFAHALRELGVVSDLRVPLWVIRIKEATPLSIEAVRNIDQELWAQHPAEGCRTSAQLACHIG